MGFSAAQGGESGFAKAQGAATAAASPAIDNVSPGGGPPSTVVTITVSGFPSGWTLADVQFGATPCSDESKASETSITCSAPAGGGTVDVRVLANGGAIDLTASNAFTYA